MKIESISITKYGVCNALELSFGDKPGLTIVYGPNEAGKSTCLSAISDFLFAIPNNSTYGQVYGGDAIRLKAIIRFSSGDIFTLCRKKGRSKTLTDGDGCPVDEAILSPALGALTRDRFSALFGLDHKGLRTGGEQLLAAEGDIGRLIIEAGGGLRALVTNADDLRDQADRLFSTRRSADRAFYRTLDAFSAADREFKAVLLTQDKYEQAEGALEAARSDLNNHRAGQRQLREKQLELQRLERVVPLLSQLDQINDEIARYSDVEALRADFATSARDALQNKLSAQQRLSEAEASRATVEAEIGALVISKTAIDAEAAIRDLEKRATHLKKQREEKPHRQDELDEQQAKLMTLRQSIGVPPDIDLSPLLPPKNVLDSVQQLATEAIKDTSTIASLTTQIEEDEASINSLNLQEAKLAEAGCDKPVGISASEFANTTTIFRKLDVARKEAKQRVDALNRRISSIGFTTIDELRAFACPDAAVIQAQIDREVSLEEELAKQIDVIATHTATMDCAIADIERLKKAGEVPTEATIVAARSTRSATWTAIREVYLTTDTDALTSVPHAQRSGTALEFEGHISKADHLADRRAVEANRIASLEVSEKAFATSKSALAAATNAKADLSARLTSIRESFARTWVDAVAFEADFGKLKSWTEARAKVLLDAEDLLASELVVQGLEAEYNAALDGIVAAEMSLSLAVDPDSTIGTRVQSLNRKIQEHSDFYSDYRNCQELIRSTTQRLAKKRRESCVLADRLSKCAAHWKDAVSKLKLNEDVAPERANEVATQWAAAEGVIDSIKLTERRLRRMDEDERQLRDQLASLSPTFELALPDDCVAASEMLKNKLDEALKALNARESLLPQYARLGIARNQAQADFDTAGEKLTKLSQEVPVGESDLLAVAERQDAYALLRQRRCQLLQTTTAAGDGIAIENLTDAAGNRSLDTIRIELQESESEFARLSDLIEADIKREHEYKQVLDRFETDDSIIKYSAERERTISEMHEIVERYVEMALARDLISAAIDQIRSEQQDPLISRAGELFSLATDGAFAGIETDVDQKGNPIVVGKRATGSTVSVETMSDGTRDQLFLAFRMASIEEYCKVAEPLPFIADDLLVHFDDDRSVATLRLLAELGKTTQVLLFTHHRSVRDGALNYLGGAVDIIDLAFPPGKGQEVAIAVH